MKFKFLGTRGSYPTSKKENKKYGGSTPCVEIIGSETRLILDAGTGITGLNFNEYLDLSRIDILLTHLHMDHIQGLAFFKPLFAPGKEIHLWGPNSNTDSLRSRLNRFLAPPIFPLPMRDLPCNLHIHELSKSTIELGEFKIISEFVIHPGPTLGFRIEHKSNVLTYIPDHEPMIGTFDFYENPKWISGYNLGKDTDVLIHDGQFTEEEYASKIGWGHSSTRHVVNFALATKAKKTYIFHHDPEHSDVQLKSMLIEIREEHGSHLNIRLAIQGKSYKVK